MDQKMKWETVLISSMFEEADTKRNDIKKSEQPVKVHLQRGKFHVKVGTPVVKEEAKEVTVEKTE